MSDLYIDVQAYLDGTLEAPQTSAGGCRSDGVRLLYSGAVNVLLGDPESGKTLCAAAMAADEMFAGGRVLWVDLDHNGAAATIARFRAYGVPADTLTDPARFRLSIPEDSEELLAIVTDAADWSPSMAVVDSLGELLPMFGANSNDADDYTRVNRITLAALARLGTAVLVIDHLAKNSQSREYGGTGTAAKKRSVDGAMLRVTAFEPFTPGIGGAASLTVVKDRHGHLRANAGSGREPQVSVFSLKSSGAMTWHFRVPSAPATNLTDAELVAQLDPPPTSGSDVARRMQWRKQRALDAFRAWRTGSPVPGTVGNHGTDGRREDGSPVPTPIGGDREPLRPMTDREEAVA